MKIKTNKKLNFFFTTNDNELNHRKRRIDKEEIDTMLFMINTPTASIIQIPYSVVKQIQKYILAH